MLSRYFKGKLDKIFSPFFRFFPDNKLIPNILTLSGLSFSLISGTFFAFDFIRVGGVFILFAGFFDIIDGSYARVFDKTSSFGAFIDSTSDRYADMFILSGLGIMYALKFKTGYLILTLVTMIGFVMVSYTKARAETIISKCDVGIMERPERMILLIIGAFTLRIDLCLWILAILTHFTALQRIWYTYQKLEVKEIGLKEVL
ncbi:CDP-alcohol phosphatidyltransferase family protein [bacterium]|nr:CDP-alcohol phosphatidyltransferase family protein [bacterium]